MSLLDRFRLDGKVAIVTGASRGIGARAATALAEMGADVVIAARSAESLASVCSEVEALGRRAVAVPCDLSDLASMRTLVDTATAELERRMLDATPMRRLGTVDDIALGVIYLASDASSFVTGKVLAIDGGTTAPTLSLGIPDL